MTTRDMLLGKFERRFVTFTVDGLQLRARNLNEGEKAQFEAGSVTEEGKVNLAAIQSQRRRLIQLCLVDDDGQQLLNHKGDLEALKQLDAAVTTQIFEACRKHCGFDVEDPAKKNSSPADAGDSLID